MKRIDPKSLLTRLGACRPAKRWIGNRTARQAWQQCRRGDWLLWVADKLGVDRKLVTLGACDCARTALPFVPPGEDRQRIAIETAERWARGEATIDEFRSAAYDASDAAYYAAYYAARAADAAYYAAHAAYYAAHAAYYAYYAAHAAYYAAHAAYYADHAAAGHAGCRKALSKMATLVRRRIPWTVVRKALETMK